MNEKRRDQRVSFQVSASLVVDDQAIASRETRDLSTGGIFVICRETLPVGIPCEVTVELNGQSSQLILKLQGKVVREVPGEGLAVEFTSIDLDSYIYLKNIVEYNQSASGEEVPEGFNAAENA